ncbi:EexN family lipoprotein [Proteus mirabilis]|uniref:EexN family lipoprotein n=1 Tax=Proteus mirabilis TaxID=584 RepID=UPI0024E069F1|nr:EexN family lipoprotein [Proteus mirabilis]
MKKMILMSALSILFLSACSEEVKSVQWWQEHPDEAVKKWKDCMESGDESANCINVKSAAKYINTPEMNKLHEERAAKIRKQMGL